MLSIPKPTLFFGQDGLDLVWSILFGDSVEAVRGTVARGRPTQSPTTSQRNERLC